MTTFETWDQKSERVRDGFAQPGEVWLTNSLVHPEDNAKNTRELEERYLENKYPDFVLRFDYEHVVDGFGDVYTGTEFSVRVSAVKGGEALAVYGRKKE